MGKKYVGGVVTANEFADYTAEQLYKLADSTQFNALERKDMKAIILELLARNKTLENSLSRF